ncbi:hypothetical protein KCU98_g2884, partial [Aureobasidium melanogenum]
MYRCRECFHNGTIVDRASKGNMKSHLGSVHSMGPFRCSVTGCAYASVRRELVEGHIRRVRRGPQQGRHAQAAPFRCGVMDIALQHETELCLLPHTVVWPNQAAPAGAPVAAPPVGPALPGPSAATSVTVATSGNDSGTVDGDGDGDEDEEMEEDEADDLDPPRPASVHSILVDKIVDLIYKATTIGCHYTDRIDGLDIPKGTHNVVGSDGHRIKVNPSGMQQNASMILCHAIEELNTAADGLRDDDLQQDQLEEFATRTCEAISQMPVALTWYLRNSSNAGNTEEDMAKLASMQQAIVDEFDTVEEDENEMEEDGDDD